MLAGEPHPGREDEIALVRADHLVNQAVPKHVDLLPGEREARLEEHQFEEGQPLLDLGEERLPPRHQHGVDLAPGEAPGGTHRLLLEAVQVCEELVEEPLLLSPSTHAQSEPLGANPNPNPNRAE